MAVQRQIVDEHWMGGPKSVHFSPYSDNAGTICGIAGEDYSIIVSDNRLAEGFNIYTRECPKLYQLGNGIVLGCAGFRGDTLTLVKHVKARVKYYEYEHNQKMSTKAVAAMLSTILYSRRFFPYYVYNLVAGLDEEGKGSIYSYDPVGSYDRETCRAGGSSSSIIQTMLDGWVQKNNVANEGPMKMSVDECLALMKDVFLSACERDIYLGDAATFNIITKDGIRTETFPLRKD